MSLPPAPETDGHLGLALKDQALFGSHGSRRRPVLFKANGRYQSQCEVIRGQAATDPLGVAGVAPMTLGAKYFRNCPVPVSAFVMQVVKSSFRYPEV